MRYLTFHHCVASLGSFLKVRIDCASVIVCNDITWHVLDVGTEALTIDSTTLAVWTEFSQSQVREAKWSSCLFSGWFVLVHQRQRIGGIVFDWINKDDWFWLFLYLFRVFTNHLLGTTQLTLSYERLPAIFYLPILAASSSSSDKLEGFRAVVPRLWQHCAVVDFLVSSCFLLQIYARFLLA